MSEKIYPENLYHYFSNSKDIERKNIFIKKAIYWALFVSSIILMTRPDFVAFLHPVVVRIIAGVIGLIFGFSAIFGGTAYYNKESGGQIKTRVRKKFSGISEEDVLRMFDSNDFQGLADAIHENNQPVQLYIDEDETGKVFYCQIMKYFSSSEFKGITDVKQVKGEEYDKYKDIIYSIKGA